jgi:hypothetical protein
MTANQVAVTSQHAGKVRIDAPGALHHIIVRGFAWELIPRIKTGASIEVPLHRR